MLLLIDVGNTRLKWALVDAASGIASPATPLGGWQLSGAVLHADLATFADAMRAHAISAALVSNVAGNDRRRQLEALLQQGAGLSPECIEWFRSSGAAAGLRNTYRDPAQLGCDRFAAAIGAHALWPRRSLVVATCGTATTIDAISASGEFLGGMILPGLGLMATALARNTAQLPQIGDQIRLPTVFADNTDDAIVSGCLAAQTGAIERAVAAHPDRRGAGDTAPPLTAGSAVQVQCIVSGGAGSMVAPHLGIPCQLVDNLVLIGLQAVALQRSPVC